MNVIINGEKRHFSPGCTIVEILAEYDIPGSFVIEVNGAIIDSAHFDSHSLKENDRMEIIRFVGGG